MHGARGVVAYWALGIVFCSPVASAAGDDPPKGRRDSLGMSIAVACLSIDGYENYELREGAALTSDEKLLVYYRPLRFRVEKKGKFYQAHLTQDGRLRKKGQKAVLFSKDKMVEYEPKNEQSFSTCYLRSMVSLKGLKPGEYEFDIILHDQLAKGATATQTLSFRVVPPGEKKPAQTPKPAPDSPDADRTSSDKD